jgi:chemotaxis protein methyltransferase CheR
MSRTLSAADFEMLRDYLRATAGLEFDESRRAGLAAIMHERVQATGTSGVADYLRMLDRPDAASERQRLLDAVTIQETHFHRARPQIEALRRHILPDVLGRAASQGREAVVWSAGCSTGEEPFTLAMLMLEVAETLPTRPRMRVVGTDVSEAALQVARAATYTGRTVDLAESAAVERWLRRDSDGAYVVRDEVRDLVEFAHHNLVTDAPPFPNGGVDLVVCRHVTIYFSRETTRTLVSRFRDVLGATGWLLMGPAESLWQVSDAFALHSVGDAFAYRSHRVAPTARPPRSAHHRGTSSAPALPAPRRQVAGSTASPGRTPSARAGAASGTTPSARTGSAAPAAAARADAAPVRGTARSRHGGVDPVAAAQAAFDAGSYDEAAKLAAQVLVADPVSAPAYLILGHSRLNKGEPASAVEPLQRAVFLDPLAGHAHFLLAVALSAAGRAEQAAPAYRAAANTLPGVPEETVRRLLDGRRLQELVQLCHRLADDAETGAESIRRGA